MLSSHVHSLRYSVYNKHELSGSYAAARANDKFTTSFGDGLPYRVYSRNERANEIARQLFDRRVRGAASMAFPHTSHLKTSW